jgi:sugar phosphate permease
VYGGLGIIAAILVVIAVSKKFSEQLGESDVRGADLASEAHVPDRLVNRNTIIIAITAVCGGLAGFGYLGLYPTFLQSQLHFSVEDAGTAASMYGLGALVGLPAGYIADRVNQKYLNVITLVVLAVVGYSLFNVATSPVAQDILSLLEGTASSGFLYVNNYSLMQRSVRSPLVGRASGLLVTCVYLPAALAGYFFALLQGPFGWGGAALLQLALLLIIPIVAMLLFDTSRLNVPARTRVEPVSASQMPTGEVRGGRA